MRKARPPPVRCCFAAAEQVPAPPGLCTGNALHRRLPETRRLPVPSSGQGLLPAVRSTYPWESESPPRHKSRGPRVPVFRRQSLPESVFRAQDVGGSGHQHPPTFLRAMAGHGIQQRCFSAAGAGCSQNQLQHFYSLAIKKTGLFAMSRCRLPAARLRLTAICVTWAVRPWAVRAATASCKVSSAMALIQSRASGSRPARHRRQPADCPCCRR